MFAEHLQVYFSHFWLRCNEFSKNLKKSVLMLKTLKLTLDHAK